MHAADDPRIAGGIDIHARADDFSVVFVDAHGRGGAAGHSQSLPNTRVEIWKIDCSSLRAPL